MTVTAELRAKFTARQTGVVVGGGTNFDVALDKALGFEFGTTAGKADLVWMKQETLGAAASESIDLAGVLVDSLGNVVTYAELVGLMVIADPANTNDVVLGGGAQAAPIVGTTVSVKPGGVLLLAASGAAGLCTIVGGASDELVVTNGAGSTSVTYTIAVLGRSI